MGPSYRAVLCDVNDTEENVRAAVWRPGWPETTTGAWTTRDHTWR